MMTIVSIGKLKEPWRTVCEMYVTRLGPYQPVRVVEVAESPIAKNDNSERITAEEARTIVKYMKPDAHVIALHPDARTPNTKKFADALEGWRRKQEIIFVIGGPLGLHESVLARANEQLSLSPLTFTHQMTRAILLEQIYRCVMREKGKYDY